MDDDPVFDLRAAAAALREEALVALAFVTLARAALRGRMVPRKIRRLMAQAERAAQRAREEARRLDDVLSLVGKGVPS